MDSATNLVEGAGNVVIHPVATAKGAVKSTKEFIKHPIESIENKIDDIKEECKEDGARCAGKITGNVAATVFVPVPTFNTGSLLVNQALIGGTVLALENNGNGGTSPFYDKNGRRILGEKNINTNMDKKRKPEINSTQGGKRQRKYYQMIDGVPCDQYGVPIY